jgi:hypothetical protein
MEKIVTLLTSRDEYDIRRAAECSMTVEELIEELEYLPKHSKIVFSNDRGYTYGYISTSKIDMEEVETFEEEEERERREQEEWEDDEENED